MFWGQFLLEKKKTQNKIWFAMVHLIQSLCQWCLQKDGDLLINFYFSLFFPNELFWNPNQSHGVFFGGGWCLCNVEHFSDVLFMAFYLSTHSHPTTRFEKVIWQSTKRLSWMNSWYRFVQVTSKQADTFFKTHKWCWESRTILLLPAFFFFLPLRIYRRKELIEKVMEVGK